jgi:ABC-type Fe3+/spermidine/putrescine transport system ATPase subunit
MPSALKIVNVSKHFKDVVAVDNVSFQVQPGEFLSLLGPSGCGKTTILRMVAGLERPTTGEIVINDWVVSTPDHIVPSEHRSLGMVFQSYAVWPHMTVFDNVAFGLRMKKVPREQIRGKVKSTLEIVGLEELAERYPTQLSGGQQQRVALARALVTEPSVLLLDEPLSNLDAKLRESMRFEIRSLQQRLGITTLYVTHSQDEALASSDRIAVMNRGKLQQIGSPHDLYHRPVNRFVAEFIGLANFLAGRILAVESDACRFQVGERLVIKVSNPNHLTANDRPLLVVRPEVIGLSSHEDSEDPELTGWVARVSFVGNIVDYFIASPLAEVPLRIQAAPPVEFKQGDTVKMEFREPGLVLVRP